MPVSLSPSPRYPGERAGVPGPCILRLGGRGSCRAVFTPDSPSGSSLLGLQWLLPSGGPDCSSIGGSVANRRLCAGAIRLGQSLLWVPLLARPAVCDLDRKATARREPRPPKDYRHASFTYLCDQFRLCPSSALRAPSPHCGEGGMSQTHCWTSQQWHTEQTRLSRSRAVIFEWALPKQHVGRASPATRCIFRKRLPVNALRAMATPEVHSRLDVNLKNRHNCYKKFCQNSHAWTLSGF